MSTIVVARSPSLSQSMLGYQPIFERLLDDVAFLWFQRRRAEDHPAYFQWDLAAMDERIQNYLRALLQAPGISWRLFEEAADTGDGGYFFTAAILAFHTLDTRNIQSLIERSAGNQEGIAGICSALAHLPGSRIHPWIKKFLMSKDRFHQHLALHTCQLRRDDPRAYLTALIQQPEIREHEDLFVCALKLAGSLKRKDLLPLLCDAMTDDRAPVKFWSAWSCGLMRELSAAPILQEMVQTNDEWQQHALSSLLLLLNAKPARDLVDHLARSEPTRRQAIEGCSVLGDASALPWLLQMARVPEFNQPATQAVLTITGISLENDWLTSTEVKEIEPADSDEDLPSVNPDKLTAAWQKNNARWQPGQRYFLGEPLHIQHLLRLFPNANQRHRRTAAFHLANLLPERPLLNHAGLEVFHL